MYNNRKNNTQKMYIKYYNRRTALYNTVKYTILPYVILTVILATSYILLLAYTV